MKLINQENTTTKASYSIAAEDTDLENYRQAVATQLSTTVKVPGFRPNKAPADMILKYADQSVLQNEFLNLAVNDLYVQSQDMLNSKVVGEPKIEITKFVPYSTLEIKVEVPIVGDIKLPDYRKLNFKKKVVKATKEQMDIALKQLQKRSSDQKQVKRAAKLGDQVVIDFVGTDAKTKEALPSATANGYTLVLGENSLIPGFEEKLVGLSETETKSFDLVFPKDYQDKSFASRKVNFKVTVTKVSQLVLPKLDDAFAKGIGPFETLDQLKTQLKSEIQAEDERRATIDFENEILNFLAENTKVELNEDLIDNEYKALLDDAKQSAAKDGQTWKEYLARVGETEESYEKRLKKLAKTRIKGGLAIGAVATKEDINITNEELDEQIANLKTRYNDPTMQEELDNPNNRRELGTRLLTEKVLDFIQKNQTKKA